MLLSTAFTKTCLLSTYVFINISSVLVEVGAEISPSAANAVDAMADQIRSLVRDREERGSWGN
jgi:hypothetical protein